MQSSADGKYRVGMVSRLTGLSTHVLRVWERRYGAVIPARTEAGGRLYSDADVHRLRLLAGLVGDGHSIGGIARLEVGELERMRTPAIEPANDHATTLDVMELRRRFLERIEALDTADAEQLLSTAAIAFSPRELVHQVVAPILVEIGRRWESGALRIAHEHAATAMFRGLLGSLMRVYGPGERGRVAVAATPAGERHELGVLMAAMITASFGYRIVHLGPDLPAAEIQFATRSVGAELLMLSVTSLSPEDARTAVSEILTNLPPSVTVVVGGRAAPALHGVRVMESHQELEAFLKRS